MPGDSRGEWADGLSREALQGRQEALKSAKSATNVYAYTYSFCGRAAVATLDLSAENVEAFHEDHWLRIRDNVMYLKLQEPAYILDAAAAPAVSPVWVRENKRRWMGSPSSVASVFDWCGSMLIKRRLAASCHVGVETAA